MKRFDSTKPKYIIILRVAITLTKNLHKRRMDFTFKVIGEELPNLANHRWDEDF